MGTAVKRMARLSTSWAFPWAWTWSEVFRGLERVWRQGKRVSVSGADEDLAAQCLGSFQLKDGQNHA
jgi:hypothetical protein